MRSIDMESGKQGDRFEQETGDTQVSKGLYLP